MARYPDDDKIAPDGLTPRNRSICQQYMKGVHRNDIARQFGISHSQVNHILTRPRSKEYIARIMDKMDTTFAQLAVMSVIHDTEALNQKAKARKRG